MWQHNYAPIGDSLGMSAPVAAIPIVVLFIMLGIVRTAAWKAAGSALISALLVALLAYGMPVDLAVVSTLYGAAYGVFPIAWIVFTSIMLYRLAVDTGKFEIIKDSVGSLTDDRRLQAMFIAFSFGAFIEGAAGFGAPVAVSGAMLAGLGFNPFYAAGICLLANTAPVAFGSIGIPVTTLANVTGLPVLELSGTVGMLCAMISIIIPGYLIVVMAGGKKAAEVLPAIIACGVSFAGVQFYVSRTMGPELTDILSSLTCIIVMVAVLKLWKPKNIMRLEGDRDADALKASGAGNVAAQWAGKSDQRLLCSVAGLLIGGVLAYLLRPSVPLLGQLPFADVLTRGASLEGVDQLLVGTAQASFNWLLAGLIGGVIVGYVVGLFVKTRSNRPQEVFMAWVPYLLLVVFVLIWGEKDIKPHINAFASNFIPASWPTVPPVALLGDRLMVPGLHNLITRIPPVVAQPAPYNAFYELNWLSASGTACLLAILATALVLRVPPRGIVKAYVDTFKQLKMAILTIASMLGLAYLMNYSGMTSTLGLALATTGSLFPFFSAVVGWLGVFLTGSDTSANALFGNLQVVTATALNLNPILTASVNSAAGVMGKMISVQSIAVAVAATGLTTADESKLFRFTIKHSVILMIAMGIISMMFAYVFPGAIPMVTTTP